MASRGRQDGLAGWLHSSQTERVLRDSPVALLVTRVGANDPPSAAERALAVILDEHRSIAAVLRGMQALVAQQPAPDITGLRAGLAWLQAFPLQMRHPKEEQYLHRRPRQRTPAAEVLLGQLEDQHRDEHRHVAQTLACLQSLQVGDAAGLAALTAHIDALANAVWQHLGLEERELLPLARQHLLPGAWDEMALAFEGHDEPAFGDLPAGEFRKLFTRIANLLPAARGG